MIKDCIRPKIFLHLTVINIVVIWVAICSSLSACNMTSEDKMTEAEADRPQTAIMPTTIHSDDPPQTKIGSCSLNLGAVDDAEAITAILNAEGAYVVEQDIGALLNLWQTDGLVADANHTPTNLTDDQTWQGIDAIRHRYVRWVFPGAPDVAQPADLVINITDSKAVVTSTTRIGDEISPGGDRWQLVRVEDCWLIQTLIFNLERP